MTKTWHSLPVIVRYRRSWRSLWLRRIPVRATFYYIVDDGGVCVYAILEMRDV